ncbi:MAG: hypothetical protein DKT66_09405 [Candidatus Melainabacteria bacterium]|nr:MAG: hypothetical protein DKT66_09405 [Candidatus Melainabacteria bacterium]
MNRKTASQAAESEHLNLWEAALALENTTSKTGTDSQLLENHTNACQYRPHLQLTTIKNKMPRDHGSARPYSTARS